MRIQHLEWRSPGAEGSELENHRRTVKASNVSGIRGNMTRVVKEVALL